MPATTTCPATPLVEMSTGLAGRYAGKVTVVTGGTMGIGEGCTRVFFAAGSHVVFCARNEKKGKEFEDYLNSLGMENKALFVAADVSNVAQMENVIDQAVETFGRVDCVINNAGWHPPSKQVDDFSVEDAKSLFDLNFISYFVACKRALPHLRKVEGNIINMSSYVGAFGQEGATTYAATKGAITAFSKALAVDEAKHRVRVNVVSPGNIWTPLWKSFADECPGAKESGEKVQHLGRMGTIEESGRLCLSIASDLTFTTGVDHLQTGGAELGYGQKMQ